MNFSGTRPIPSPWPHPKRNGRGTGAGDRDTGKVPRQRDGMGGGGRLAREKKGKLDQNGLNIFLFAMPRTEPQLAADTDEISHQI